LNHFEHRIENPDVLEERIRLIEGLTCQRRVIVISAVDPLYYLSNLLTDPNSAKLITRLNAALSGFTHRTVFKQEAVSSTTKARATHG
jgi:hypothetical protein